MRCSLSAVLARLSGLGTLLFPPRCVWCDADLTGDDEAVDRNADQVLVCRDCAALFPTEQRPRCERCGATLEGQPAPSCAWCVGHRLRFDAVVPWGPYDGALRAAVLRMKWPSGEAVAAAMARLYWRHMGGRLQTLNPDVVVPVPMHWSRRVRRGVNSTEIVAASLARDLHRPLLRRAVQRCHNTKVQKDLTPRQRFRNVQGAFRATANYDFKGAAVLLTDDVLTTGATCSELARLLKQLGAARVGVAVLARAEGERRA